MEGDHGRTYTWYQAGDTNQREASPPPNATSFAAGSMISMPSHWGMGMAVCAFTAR